MTPREKGAGEDIRGEAIPSEDGGAVALYTIPRFGPQPQRTGSALVFRRESGGWAPISITPPGIGDASVAQDPLLDASLSTISFGVLSEGISGFESTVQPLLTGPVGGPYQLVAEIPLDRSEPQAFEKSRFLKQAGSANLTTIAFQSTDHELLGTATGTDPGAFDLYEYREGSLRQVNVTTGGSTIGACGATLGYGTDPEHRAMHNAVSADGSKIFFTAPDPRPLSILEPECENPSRLYVRVNGSETIEASAPEPGVTPPTQYPAFFAGASADGRYVLFSTQTALTADAEGLTDNELYLYDTQSGQLTRVSHGETGTAAGELSNAGLLLGREYGVAISEDGSTVYFVANGQLTADAPAGGEKLYRYDVASDHTTYIATVTPSTGRGEQLFPTRDGRFLDFSASSAQGPSIDSEPGIHEIYRYSAATNQVLCASCPNGGASAGATQPVVEAASGTVLDLPDTTPLPQVISDDGRYVFFNSRDHLSPEDTSNLEGAGPELLIGEVYEWVAQGTEGCAAPGGCQRLLSSGTETHLGSPLLGGSADGSNVFFLTHSKLLPSDADERNDIYDARIDGGFPEAKPAAPCSGEACQGEPSAQPGFEAPGSQGFAGKGNVRPPSRCARLARRANQLARRARKTGSARLARRARALRARARHCKHAHGRTSK
ncbi:MAG: TolB family protein [Solirubrobacterales bacterium]